MRHTAILYVRGVPVEATFDHTHARPASHFAPGEPEEVDFVRVEIHGEDVQPFIEAGNLWRELEKAAIERVKRDMREAA